MGGGWWWTARSPVVLAEGLSYPLSSLQSLKTMKISYMCRILGRV